MTSESEVPGGGRDAVGDSPWGAAHGATGRVVTWPAPDMYVLVQGVLLRAVPEGIETAPGQTVELRVRDDPQPRLVAVAVVDHP